MKTKKLRSFSFGKVCATILVMALALTGCAGQGNSDVATVTTTPAEETSETASSVSDSETTEGMVTSEDVSFQNEDSGLNLAGILFKPAGFDESSQYPAIVVTGPMLSVKEQAQSIYAGQLAQEGYITLVFDYSYFGESEGEPRQLEEPDIKASDISSAVTFLQSLSYVDGDRIGGLGICGSGSYMPYAAVQDDRIKAVTSVVPATTMNSMIMMPTDQAEADREAYEAGESEPAYIINQSKLFWQRAALPPWLPICTAGHRCQGRTARRSRFLDCGGLLCHMRRIRWKIEYGETI